MSLTEPCSPLSAATCATGTASLNRLKLQLSQLEMQLSRLAVVYGLGYGCLQDLAGNFLGAKRILLDLARQHENDSDLVDLAETLLTDASDHDLCDLEERLVNMRRFAQDPGKQHLAPAYQVLMSDLLALELDLQSALQKALGNIAS